MLLTNIAVAQQIAHHIPEQALLRRHEEPIERRLTIFKERAARLGFEFDTSSAGAFQRSFDAVTDPTARKLLQIIAYKAMHTAKYFCAGMLDIAKYSHYALNVPLYTHFTSPIRRYADVIVHRQLESIIMSGAGNEPKFAMDRDSVAKVAQQCNMYVLMELHFELVSHLTYQLQQEGIGETRAGTVDASVPLCAHFRSYTALWTCYSPGGRRRRPRCCIRCAHP